MRLNIRWRLTLWNIVALAAVLALFATLVYLLFRQALYEQTDRLLRAALGQLKTDSGVESATGERINHWVEEYRDHQQLFCVVYRPDGAVYAHTPELIPASMPPFPASLGERAEYDVDLPGIGRQRVMAERQRLGGRDFVVLLLAPLEAVDVQLARMRVVLLTAGLLVLVLPGVLAYWLARKALAPMDRLRRSADAITADRLDQRLMVPNPHDELGLLAQTVNAMIARLERSFAEVRRFTADASHELRTPLTVLRTEVEVALRKQLSAPEHVHLLGSVLEELGRMSRLTDQLLTLSRRDAGVEQFASVPLDLYALVAGVVEAMQPLAESKGLRLRMYGEGPVEVRGDEGRLRQVFINLLDNALKYTPEGGTVTARVGKRDQSGTVSVEDTGIGIPPEHLPHVFDRFYRVDKARTRAEGGTGLGLSIAQSIVHAHGGTIEITSALGQGTVCRVTMDKAASPAPATPLTVTIATMP
jgi:two-component system heavy metal sensor histidine kinase CusS